MLDRTLLLVPALLVSHALAAPQGHPHFDDGGTLTWHKSLKRAQATARQQSKLIFIEYGRKA